MTEVWTHLLQGCNQALEPPLSEKLEIQGRIENVNTTI